jgi:hypothetical protein
MMPGQGTVGAFTVQENSTRTNSWVIFVYLEHIAQAEEMYIAYKERKVVHR